MAKAKLIDAIDKNPYSFRMSTKTRKRYLACIQEAVLAELLKDNIVCQGLAAHLYVRGVSHVLKVRIVTDPEIRVHQLSSQSGISAKRAEKQIARQTKLRQQWSRSEFGCDETDPAKYDLMINISQIEPDEAVKIIGETVQSRKFQPMTYSRGVLHDLELASRVRVLLMERFPSCRVRANGSNLVIETKGLKYEKKRREAAIREIAESVQDVDYVEVHFSIDFFRQAAESLR